MSLSGDEQAALAAMEIALREQDPELARTLTTFTRPRGSRWPWVAFVGLLVLAPAALALGFTLHSKVLVVLAAVLIAALFTTIARVGGFGGEETAAPDDPECGYR